MVIVIVHQKRVDLSLFLLPYWTYCTNTNVIKKIELNWRRRKTEKKEREREKKKIRYYVSSCDFDFDYDYDFNR